ncbi:50S ribosomal protein L25 [Atopobacter phocae]|uniref:50S ribosomal protein L25 n=1 Tax=Atopobacter phocae TaxID=136492 RepID=UPI00047291CE|nr:50S ribosomal protein L25 [Atopobacter phocae]
MKTLKAELREHTGSGQSKKDRAAGRVPAVMYGHGNDATNVTVDVTELEFLIREEGANAVFNLEIEGKKQQVFLQSVQRQSIKRGILSIDLLSVKAGDKIVVPVPVILEDGDKRTVGIVSKNLSEVEIETAPSNIPEHFIVNTSHLEIGDSITVASIEVPEGVVILADMDTTIASVSAPQQVDEHATTEAAEPSVIGQEEE